MMLAGVNFWSFIVRFITCHNIITIALLFGCLFKRSAIKKECKNWLYTLNTILPFFLTIFASSFIYIIFDSWKGQGTVENFYSTESAWANSWIKLSFQILLTLVPGLVFFFKKLRLSFVLIISNLVVYNFNFFRELLFRFNKDYLASVWKLREDITTAQYLLQWLVPLIIIALMYFLLYRRNKLPNPSLFLKKYAQ